MTWPGSAITLLVSADAWPADTAIAGPSPEAAAPSSSRPDASTCCCRCHMNHPAGLLDLERHREPCGCMAAPRRVLKTTIHRSCLGETEQLESILRQQASLPFVVGSAAIDRIDGASCRHCRRYVCLPDREFNLHYQISNEPAAIEFTVVANFDDSAAHSVRRCVAT